MRFIVFVKATKDSEAGRMPSEEMLSAMAKFNEELVKAGVLLAAEGLHSSGHGARVQYLDGKRTVIDGPFTESKEMVAGYYLIQVGSKEEAIEWASRCPVEYAVQPGQEAVVEVRLVADASELPEATEDQIARSQSVRDQIVGG